MLSMVCKGLFRRMEFIPFAGKKQGNGVNSVLRNDSDD